MAQAQAKNGPEVWGDNRSFEEGEKHASALCSDNSIDPEGHLPKTSQGSKQGNALAVQWLGLRTLTAESLCIPSWGTKIPPTSQPKKDFFQ